MAWQAWISQLFFDYWLQVWHIIVSVSPYHADHLMTSPSWWNHFEARAIKAMNQSIGHTSKFISHSSHVHIFGPKPESPALIVSNRPMPCGAASSLPSFSMWRNVSASVCHVFVEIKTLIESDSGIFPKLSTQSSLATMFSKLTAFETCKWCGETLVRLWWVLPGSGLQTWKLWSHQMLLTNQVASTGHTILVVPKEP